MQGETTVLMEHCAGACTRINPPRFGWDTEKGKCVKFEYGGCQGNDNNFETRQACKEACKKRMRSTPAPQPSETTVPPKSKEVCQLPLEKGPCRAIIQRFGYDAETGDCVKFEYGGCAGNENNFETRKECRKTCVKN
ncbi:unnamed protein product [Heligmosomoides polygyrus]|uniref:Kunitz/Bovine pancreatic trypsin inhibitor domain protein n=1 Tax=Heligmosomoides polygyrus TaxID=6339 RepID=A0A3P8CDK5_HELPZ|nr:unnamed protein product [Heligmosomoides polygyrus]